jgi:SOS-response transcriptional repressor LexA
MGIKDRLVHFARVRYNLGMNRFEEYTGLSIGLINKIRDGISSSSLEKIMAKCPELNVEWLITGKGPMTKPIGSVPNQDTIPLLPFDAVAGGLLDNITGDYPEAIPMIPFTNGKADFAIHVDGDSMYPRYHSGDVLLVRKVDDPSFFQWGKVYVLATSQGCVVKRLYPDKENAEYVICHSENSDLYPDYHIRREDIVGVGLVIGHIGLD